MTPKKITDLSAEEPSEFADQPCCRTRPSRPIEENELVPVAEPLQRGAPSWGPRDYVAITCTGVGLGSALGEVVCTLMDAPGVANTALGGIGTAAMTTLVWYFAKK